MENTSTDNALVPTSFLNGDSIVGPSVLEYAERYQTFLNKSAEAMLVVFETVYEANKTLSTDDFNLFKEEVGLNSKSTVSKFLAIGRDVSRLRPYSDQLPHAWTTLYRLVQLKQFQFDKVKSSLSPEMTAADIQRILGHHTTSTKKDYADIKLYLFKMTSDEKKDFILELKELVKDFEVVVNTSNDLNNEMRQLREKKGA